METLAGRAMKTRAKKKNNFFLCFRPVAANRALTSDGQQRSGDPVNTYIAVADKGDLMIPAMLSPLAQKERSKLSGGEPVGRRKNARRIFSRMVKSVLLDSSSSKKVLAGKVRNDSYRSDSNLSVKRENEKSVAGSRRKLSDNDGRKINSTVSPSSSLSSSSFSNIVPSSSFSSSSSSSSAALPWSITESKSSRSLNGSKRSFRSNSFDPKESTFLEPKHSNIQEPQQKTSKIAPTKCYVFNLELLLILIISLSVVIFWGRVCAILSTLAWLYFVPRRKIDNNPPESVRKLPEIDSKESKKKVIMEGLLDRSHRV